MTTVIKLNKYGSVLTGREFGTDVSIEILKEAKPPVSVDFQGVESMGSSFGDEVIPPLASKQGGIIMVKNANDTIWASLRDIAKDAGIEIKKEV